MHVSRLPPGVLSTWQQFCVTRETTEWSVDRTAVDLAGYTFSCPRPSLNWKEILDTLIITDLFFLCDAFPCKNVLRMSMETNICFLMHRLEGNSIDRQCLLLSCRAIYSIQAPLEGGNEWTFSTGVLGTQTAYSWVPCRYKFE